MKSDHYEPIVATDQCHATASSLASHLICCSCLVSACGIKSHPLSFFENSNLLRFVQVTQATFTCFAWWVLCLSELLWVLDGYHIRHIPQAGIPTLLLEKSHIWILLPMSSTSGFNTTNTRYPFLGFSSQNCLVIWY
jgi:hypothetical protein